MLDYDQPDQAADEDETSSTYLTFDLGGQTLGVEVRFVREILDLQKITRLPNAPIEVQGVIDVRGVSVPILDLRTRLGVGGIEVEGDQRIVVLELGGQRRAVGVFADRVRNVDVIPRANIEPVPTEGLGGWDTSSLMGLARNAEDLIVLIDIDRILGTPASEIDLNAGYGFF